MCAFCALKPFFLLVDIQHTHPVSALILHPVNRHKLCGHKTTMMQAATMYQEDSSSPMPYAIVLGYDSNNIPSNQDQI